jgi:hypothetical protein
MFDQETNIKRLTLIGLPPNKKIHKHKLWDI